jgi:hypothetical protein
MNSKEKGKKTILIICYNTLHNDPRVLRQIKVLKEDFKVITAGYSDSNLGVEHIQLKDYVYKMIDFFFNYPYLLRKFFAGLTQIYLKTTKFRNNVQNFILQLPFLKKYYFEKRYWTKIELANYEMLKNLNPNLIIANDIHALPIALKVGNSKAKVVFDAHEYHPEELNEIVEWRRNIKPFIEYLCERYMKEADLMFTVSSPIAKEYEKNYNVKPIVITNAPPYVELDAKKTNGIIKLIHHGGAIKERLLEETIGVMDFLNNDYTLDLMLVGSDTTYLNFLKEKFKNDRRITFVDPVPTHQISKKINQYDVGVYILPPLNFNNINALPNKFFEFIQGRLAVAIGPMPAMAEIVKKFNLGVIADNYTSRALAEEIKKLSREEIYECKRNAERAAMELSEEGNKELMIKEIKKLIQ